MSMKCDSKIVNLNESGRFPFNGQQSRSFNWQMSQQCARESVMKSLMKPCFPLRLQNKIHSEFYVILYHLLYNISIQSI